MKNWIKKYLGLDKLEQQIEQDRKALEEKEAALLSTIEEKETALEEKEAALLSTIEEKETALEEKEAALLSTIDPKEHATRNGRAWVNVLDVKVNDDNIRNGFFELDWNEYFIKDLIYNGYGTEADREEEIVDRWWREVIYNMLEEADLDTSRNSGYINVVPMNNGKSEIS